MHHTSSSLRWVSHLPTWRRSLASDSLLDSLANLGVTPTVCQTSVIDRYTIRKLAFRPPPKKKRHRKGKKERKGNTDGKKCYRLYCGRISLPKQRTDHCGLISVPVMVCDLCSTNVCLWQRAWLQIRFVLLPTAETAMKVCERLMRWLCFICYLPIY